jgi:hypothetical protein
MGKLIYLINASLDGFAETVDHSLDWTIPDDELLSWFNERSRTLDASLCSRRICTPFFPTLRDRIGLRLIETHTLGSGVVYLGYETVR